MLARTDSRARALFLLVLMTLVAGAIGGRLAWWHVIEHDRLTAMAADQLAQNEEIPAQRGTIRDARGLLLATSVQVFSVYATPPNVTDPESEAVILANALDLSREEMLARLTDGRAWVWLKRRVDPAVSDRIRALGMPGIGLLPETKRVYPTAGAAPGSTMAAQLLGYVNLDGSGQYGLESAQNALLSGRPGQLNAQEDVAGRQIGDSVQLAVAPRNGSDVTLTIDSGVQHLLESQLYSTYVKNHAHGATGIVMDVETGAILAMASFPTYNANAYASTNPTLFDNPAVAHTYEPGSVMKAFTIAAALDAGAVNLKTQVLDNNNLRIRGERIQNADRFDHPWGHGKLTPQQVLQLSNNNGAARIGLKLGGERLYQAFMRYGFGQPTGIDIAGEVGGKVWDPASKNASGDLTTAQNAFGQGLTVTAVQLVAGYAAIANGGTLVTPHVVAGYADGSGVYHPNPIPKGERVMRPETSRTMINLLLGAIDGGIARGARVAGYKIAGKTGTAEIAGPVKVRDAAGNLVTRTKYIPGWIDSSFISIYPASHPKLVTLILLHRPATWGRYLMVQRPESVFRLLAPQLLDYLAIPPDRPSIPVASR
jgi:cell division protein FtsI (penicillin-binding protein 3)